MAAINFSILIACFVHIVVSENSIIVETPLGKLEGTKELSRDNREYFAFKGIKYAENPERFQIAKLVSKWEGVKDAKKFGNACPHFDVTILTGKEDCLYLNIYSPLQRSASDKTLPVMVWFHPGGFIGGKSDDYDPNFFMDESVILVTVNYRLGALGFLSTGDKLIQGNNGLRDQNLALQFVQNNIHSFGGDKNRVTIFGCSAGSISVHFHMISPMSKGLFRNAISQSGVISPWSFHQNPRHTAEKLGTFLKCPTKSMEDLVECLKTKTVQEIVTAQSMFAEWAFFPFAVFNPVIETNDSESPRFIEPTFSLNQISNITVPWIVGYTEDEGASLSVPLMKNPELIKQLNDDYLRVLPIMLSYNHISDITLKNNLTERILNYYFGDEEIGEETWQSLSNMLSDRFFIHPTERFARQNAKNSAIYPYEFTFPGAGESSPAMKYFMGISGDYGVTHADDVQYLFNGFWGAAELTDPIKHESFELSKNFVKLWTSFATHNSPTATWKDALKWDQIPANIGSSPIKYYEISGKTTISESVEIKKRVDFWDELDIDNISPFDSTSNNLKESKDEL